ncbi:MAG: toll/interleukin-1 receptor domain-containing protein [Gammaproteobacteria bacterium]|nr:toll/interleukin-1 receptor domain-containing protein [Gammaproteobacteria bacterium]
MDNLFDAFISYGRADSKAFATKLHKRLAAENFNIWFDQNDIPLGVDFQNQIDDGIEKSHNFLFIIAPHSVNSEYCLKEILLAIKRCKRIIPLLHVEPKDKATWNNMHPVIAKLNWIYFREDQDNFEAAYQGLTDLLRRHAAYVKQHTQFLARALTWERQQKQTQFLLIEEDRREAESWQKIRFENEQAPCTLSDLQCEFICESIKNVNNLMTQVFFSYAAEDGAIMARIRKTLARENITSWASKTDIKTGAKFQEEIDKGIEEADNFVYLISQNSLLSKYCQQELAHAEKNNKRIISLLIKEMAPEQLPANIGRQQFIDLSGHDDPEKYRAGADKLIKELNTDAHYHRQHKLLLAKALKWERQDRNAGILLRGYNLQHAEAWLKTAVQRREHPRLCRFIRNLSPKASASLPMPRQRCSSLTLAPMLILPAGSMMHCNSMAKPLGLTRKALLQARTFNRKFFGA